MQAEHSFFAPMISSYIPTRPTPPQIAFLAMPHREVLYGGAVGSGKSFAMFMAALQYADHPGYHALIVRKNYPMLVQPNGLLFLAKELLTPQGVSWSSAEMRFTFPSGATLTFRHFEDASAEANFQGSEYHFIGIDEATDFTEDQVMLLTARLRQGLADKIPLRLRLTAYPYGPGKEWVYRRYVLEGKQNGRPFIRARLEDNPYLDVEGYKETLRGLGEIRFRQLMGDWTIREEGTRFKPAWFDDHYIEEGELPPRLSLCRAWDLAGTEGGGDYTAGALLGRSKEGLWYLLDVRRAQHSSLGVERLIEHAAEEDRAWARARGDEEPTIVMEQEPGSSGKTVVDYYRRHVLAAYTIKGVTASGSKDSRAKPLSARAEAGDVYLVRGTWVGAFLDEIAGFPTGAHDDQVDAISMAFNFLAEKLETPDISAEALHCEPYTWRDPFGYY